ncbi:MAG TPA: VOC family protein [Steroidobacteraceae bacterium]
MIHAQKIFTFLWFNNQAEEAAKFYVSIFKNSKIEKVSYYPKKGPGSAASVMTVRFSLDGQTFVALNGGGQFPFTEAISLFVNCETQAEVDELWKELSKDGEEGDCGWLKDRFGVSWQIVPKNQLAQIEDDDPIKVQHVMEAMFTMKKLDMARLSRSALGPKADLTPSRSPLESHD